MAELFEILWQLVNTLWALLFVLLGLVLQWALILVWLAWALLGVNWKKTWPTLAAGGWIPFTLIVVLAAIVYTALDPGPSPIIGFPNIPQFWWQLIIVSVIAALTLFCGWLQGVFGWTPPEIKFDPPEVAHDHGHH